ncbi:MAG: DsbA family protein [Deltaproteobacteria bacterium]|nr:DsbA family protein [Deltaproteobacteria bacterium]
MIEKYPQKVRLVFKNYPLRNHKFARQAAAAALSAQAQGKFWEFHDKLFENYRTINEEKIVEIRDALNLNPNKFDSMRKSSQVASQIQNDVRLGREIGLRGTPSVYVNGRLQRGRNLEGLSSAVEAALKRVD